jgi:hypothetical protein
MTIKHEVKTSIVLSDINLDEYNIELINDDGGSCVLSIKNKLGFELMIEDCQINSIITALRLLHDEVYKQKDAYRVVIGTAQATCV